MTPPSVDEVKAEALRIGFAACGIARLDPSVRGDALDRWLAAGYGGTMRYIHRQARKRKQPATITTGARSAVVVLENYAAPPDERPHPGDAFKVAAYARGMDYHVVTLGRLHILAEWLKARGAGLAHAWVDDGPVPDRELAERAGLGWIGKNTMLIHPRIGSYTFIGSVFTDLDLPAGPTVPADLCGSCTRCLDACPTGAFVDRPGARRDALPVVPHDRVQRPTPRRPPAAMERLGLWLRRLQRRLSMECEVRPADGCRGLCRAAGS